MTLMLFMGAALAGTGLELDVKVTGPDQAVVFEQTLALPAEVISTSVDVGGVPHRVDVASTVKHDTVVVEAVVYELRGRKAKPVEVTRPKLILYEAYPGHIQQVEPAPRGAEADLVWSLDAVWFGKDKLRPGTEPEPAPEAAPEAPAEAPAEGEPTPAADTPAQ